MHSFHHLICVFTGLRLTLDIGQYEYIPKIGEAAGVVVVVHPGDQMSFPEDEGVVVLPGHRTGIAIREVGTALIQHSFLFSTHQSKIKNRHHRGSPHILHMPFIC